MLTPHSLRKLQPVRTHRVRAPRTPYPEWPGCHPQPALSADGPQDICSLDSYSSSLFSSPPARNLQFAIVDMPRMHPSTVILSVAKDLLLRSTSCVHFHYRPAFVNHPQRRRPDPVS